MASLKNIIFLCIAILPCFVQSDPQVSRRDLSSLINLLKQKHSSNRPIVVILNSGSSKVNRNQYRAETSDEVGTWNVDVPHLLLQQHKAKTVSPLKKSTKSLLQLKQRDRQLHQLQIDEDSQREDNVLRSPVIKKLLRISNRLQCNAKDDCQDKCKKKYKGKLVVNCSIKCEAKYECDEEERDPCDDNECGVDSCGNDAECQMSTKGERLVVEETKCKRC